MRAGVVALIGVVAALMLAEATSLSFPVRIGSTTLMRPSAVAASAARPQGAVVCAMGDADTRWIQQGSMGGTRSAGSCTSTARGCRGLWCQHLLYLAADGS